jgi:kynurenine formamidase
MRAMVGTGQRCDWCRGGDGRHDAGAAAGFAPPFPCHSFLLGAGKYGLTQLQNLHRLPATGAVVIASPLPIVGGSGSPARVLALVERESA